MDRNLRTRRSACILSVRFSNTISMDRTMNMGRLTRNKDLTQISSLSRYLIARNAAALTSAASWNRADLRLIVERNDHMIR